MITLKEAAAALGGNVVGGTVRAPGPGHSHKDRSLSIKLNPDGFIVYSHARDDWRLCRDYVAERLGLEKFEPRRWRRTAKETPARVIIPGEIDGDTSARIAAALRIWSQSMPLNGTTLGWRYFTERRRLHIGLLELDHALRWHEGEHAVIALMTDTVSAEPVGIHRAFLDQNGCKVERKMLGRQGTVRLSPDNQVTLGLGITEGIEDGLAVLLSGVAPIWAATSAGAIANFPVLSGIECLTIFSDADRPGISAASTCADRWIEAGREACISSPKDLGHDNI